MIKNKKKLLKQIDHDVHLKYRCPECSVDHWLSLREAQTDGFIIVCECNNVFKVRTVEKIVVRHKDKKIKRPLKEELKPVIPEIIVEPVPIELEEEVTESKVEENIPLVEEPEVIEKPIIPDDMLKSSCEVLVNYGFTVTEAKELIRKTYANNPVDSIGAIVTNCLKTLKIGDNEDVAVNETNPL
jgi:hypothetical protein